MAGPDHKGKQQGHVEHHHDAHHDAHHDSHHEHHSEVDPRIKGTPLDFSHKHPVFEINLEKKGP